MDYIKKRWLSEAEMENLIEEYSKKEFPKEEFRCPRCKSKKSKTKRAPFFTGKYYGAFNYRNVHYTCQVCGLIFEPEESLNASLLDKIKKGIYKISDWIDKKTLGNI